MKGIHMFCKFRVWLIQRLIGQMTVVANANIGYSTLLSISKGKTGFIYNSTLTSMKSE